MKTLRPTALLVLTGAVAMLSAAAVTAATLEVTVENVQGAEGTLMLAVYDEAGYRSTPLRSAAQPASAAHFAFPALPAGGYAIAVFHDRNGNGKLDTNLMGIPSEPYGFSVSSGGMGPPAWSAARFELPEAGTSVTVKLSSSGGPR